MSIGSRFQYIHVFAGLRQQFRVERVPHFSFQQTKFSYEKKIGGGM
jgi:hypothetical protein